MSADPTFVWKFVDLPERSETDPALLAGSTANVEQEAVNARVTHTPRTMGPRKETRFTRLPQLSPPGLVAGPGSHGNHIR